MWITKSEGVDKKTVLSSVFFLDLGANRVQAARWKFAVHQPANTAIRLDRVERGGVAECIASARQQCGPSSSPRLVSEKQTRSLLALRRGSDGHSQGACGRLPPIEAPKGNCAGRSVA